MGNIYTEATVIRKGDASTRYTQYAEKSFNRVKMEPIHNILTYCKTFGSVTINNSCGNTSTIVFENDGTLSNLPTWERTKQIAENAGKTITTNNGISRCGIGMEAFAWSCRQHYSKSVTMHFVVIRKKLKYGFSMIFDSNDKDGVKATLHEPIPFDAKDNITITYEGIDRVNMASINLWKSQIEDALYLLNKNIKFNFTLIEENGDRIFEVLKPTDYLYKSKLNNTDNFKVFKYYYINPITNKTEYLTFEIADVRDIENTCLPELSGGTLIYNGIAAVNRGINGWGLLKNAERYDSTKNGIRFNIYAESYVFNQICGNSGIKNECRSLRNIVNNDYSKFILFDCDTNEKYSIEDIIKDVEHYIFTHKSDRRNVIDKNEVIKDFNNLKNEELELINNAFIILVEKCNSVKNKKFASIVDAMTIIKNNKKEIMTVNV